MAEAVHHAPVDVLTRWEQDAPDPFRHGEQDIGEEVVVPERGFFDEHTEWRCGCAMCVANRTRGKLVMGPAKEHAGDPQWVGLYSIWEPQRGRKGPER